MINDNFKSVSFLKFVIMVIQAKIILNKRTEGEDEYDLDDRIEALQEANIVREAIVTIGSMPSLWNIAYQKKSIQLKFPACSL